MNSTGWSKHLNVSIIWNTHFWNCLL